MQTGILSGRSAMKNLRANAGPGLGTLLLVFSVFASPAEAAPLPFTHGRLQAGEIQITYLDSLGKHAFDAGNLRRGEETDLDYRKMTVPAGAGSRKSHPMQQGPSTLFGLEFEGERTVSRRMLDDVDGADSLWTLEQYSTVGRPKLKSRLSLEGGHGAENRLYGIGDSAGWPLFDVPGGGMGCVTLQQAWVMVSMEGDHRAQDPEGLKVGGNLEVCHDQKGRFLSRYPGYDSLEFKRYRVRFSPNGRTVRQRSSGGGMGQSEASAEVREATREIEREKFLYYNETIGPFLAVNRSRAAGGARWTVEFQWLR